MKLSVIFGPTVSYRLVEILYFDLFEVVRVAVYQCSLDILSLQKVHIVGFLLSIK